MNDRPYVASSMLAVAIAGFGQECTRPAQAKPSLKLVTGRSGTSRAQGAPVGPAPQASGGTIDRHLFGAMEAAYRIGYGSQGNRV